MCFFGLWHKNKGFHYLCKCQFPQNSAKLLKNRLSLQILESNCVEVSFYPEGQCILVIWLTCEEHCEGKINHELPNSH